MPQALDRTRFRDPLETVEIARDLGIQRLLSRESELGVDGRRTNLEFCSMVIGIAFPADVLTRVDTCVPSQTFALADLVVVKAIFAIAQSAEGDGITHVRADRGMSPPGRNDDKIAGTSVDGEAAPGIIGGIFLHVDERLT